MTAEPGINTNIRYLVVESQSDLRRTIVAMLKGMGAAAVQNAATGEEALELLQKSPIDFVLCDWSAPEKSGMELLQYVRNNPVTAHIPFIMTSRRDQVSDEEFAEAVEWEVDGHIIKPLNQQEIENKVRQILKVKAEFLESDVCLARAAAFTDIGAYDEAEAEIETAQKKKPEAPRVWVKSGELFEEMGKDDRAKACYTEARTVDGEYVRALDGLANILEKEGKGEEAFELLQEAVKISPKNRDRQFRVAKSLLAQGSEDEARIALHNALSHEADPAARNAAAAEFFLSVGRADLAESEYAFALGADPENIHYYNRLGIAFRRQKKFKEAVDNYRKALVVSPDDPVIYYNMALALAEAGDKQQSIGALRRALVLDPKFTEAEKVLVRLTKE